MKKYCVQKLETGFTLMEVLVVVSILAILATTALLNYKTVVDRGRTSAVLDEIKQYAEQEEIARGDTEVFWRLQDLQSPTMPHQDIYGNPINLGPGQFSYTIDSTLWKGPYLDLQKTVPGFGQIPRFDANGNPLDYWGHPYELALFSISSGTQGITTTYMNDTTPTAEPSFGVVISFGLDGYPGNAKANDGVTYDQKTAHYWLYYNEPGSDDIYYVF